MGEARVWCSICPNAVSSSLLLSCFALLIQMAWCLPNDSLLLPSAAQLLCVFLPSPSLFQMAWCLPNDSLLVSSAIFFLFFVAICHSYAHAASQFYERCRPSKCGNSLLAFPFAYVDFPNFCGPLHNVHCKGNGTLTFSMEGDPAIEPVTYRVVGDITENSYNNRTITIADDLLFGCHALSPYPDLGENWAYPDSADQWEYLGVMFSLTQEYAFGTFLNCTQPSGTEYHFQPVPCMDCETTNNVCFFASAFIKVENCMSYRIAIPKNYNITAEKKLRQFLQRGFPITWNKTVDCQSCETTNGICGADPSYDAYDFEFACLCPDNAHRKNCSDGEIIKIGNNTRIISAVCASASAFVLIALVIIIVCVRRKRMKLSREEEQDLRGYMDALGSTPLNVENFLQGYTSGMPTRYSYSQIRKYTNNFAHKLGQGGFGTVFKGKLPNGCEVAVKVLDKSKQSVKQFIAEVATVGRIHHFNLVRLLGYSFKGTKRALVYEYVVNGSLEKYIHGSGQHVLQWKQLYAIAIGTARGIAYLHEECRSRILHCDIKPHNILLDADFSPKVSDFGLAKLVDRENTHISMTAARGTPGYAAPEMWSRNCGPVTDRSDVYSFGMLVMEMVGGRKNFDVAVSTSSQFYFPEWAFKQVDKGDFGRLIRAENMTEADENIAKKLSLVGLWCIQYNASHRPPMTKVIQMLEGSIEMTTPPSPFPVDTPMPSVSGESSSTNTTTELVNSAKKEITSPSK